MTNLIKTISNSYFAFLLFILIFSFSQIVLCTENKILFKIKDKVFTSLDYEKRLEYLDFVGNNNNLNKNTIIKDYISANLFFEYYLETNNKKNFEKKINEIYTNILNINKENKKNYIYEINKKNILFNIKIDYIRKIILENILNNNLNNLNNSKKDFDILYKINIEYISFKNTLNNELYKEIINSENLNSEKIKILLKNNNINFFVKDTEINNIDKVEKKIKDKIISNKKFFIIENNNIISLIFIKKSFETYKGLTANLYSVKSKNDIKDKELLCENLLKKKETENIFNKEYNFNDLNNELKQKLVSINDYVKFIDNENNNVYVVLCDIKFDSNVLNNNNLNKLININVSEIEEKFINKYSRVYKLVVNE